jgi:hypothetical protein
LEPLACDAVLSLFLCSEIRCEEEDFNTTEMMQSK